MHLPNAQPALHTGAALNMLAGHSACFRKRVIMAGDEIPPKLLRLIKAWSVKVSNERTHATLLQLHPGWVNIYNELTQAQE